MPVSLFCGPFQPSLERKFLDHLAARRPGPGRLVAVVAPSRRMAERLQRLLALEHGLAFLNLRFHTFFSLAMEIIENAAPTGDVDAVVGDELFHDKLIDSLLRKRGGDARLSRGLAAAHRAGVRDLIEAGVDPQLFREHLSELIPDAAERARLESLLDLQGEYVARLRAARVMPLSGVELLATRLAQESPDRALGRYAEVLYYGFYDLNGVQADFFSAVCRAQDAAVFFPYRKDHPAFRFAERFYQVKLLSTGAVPTHAETGRDSLSLKGRDSERIPGPGPSFMAPALGAALDALFDPSVPPSDIGPGALRIINVSGARDEVWRAAKEILALAERPEDPVAFDDIGVVARGLEDYRAAVAEVFEEHAIPFSLYASEPLIRHPLAKLCVLTLTAARRDFPAALVRDVVESPWFRLDRFPGRSRGAELVANWKSLIERTGVHSGWLQWRGKIAPKAKEDFELFGQAVAEGRPGSAVPREDSAALWSFVSGLHERLNPAEPMTWARCAEYAWSLLSDTFALDAAPNAPEAPVVARLRELLEELKAFDLLGEKPSWADFLEAWEEKVSSARLDAPPARGGVRVLGAMDARGESFRVLFLLGLREGVFPRQVREDPLLRDSARALLQQPGGYWISPKMAGYDEEKLLFYLLAASARERLYCIYPRSDDSGRAQVPSIYLRELCRAAGVELEGDRNERVERQPLKKLEQRPPDQLSPKEITLLLANDSEDASRFLEALAADARLLKSGLERVGDLRRFGEPHGMDGLTGRPGQYLVSLLRDGLSPSALDRFATCPFKFYAQHVLGLRETDEASERGEVLPTARGVLYHLIFQRFHEALRAAGYWTKKDDSWRARLESAIEAVFAESGWEQMGLYPVLWESLKRQMADHARRLAALDIAELLAGGFVPADFERRLRAPAPLGLEGLAFSGRLDRVDVNEEQRLYRVVDYKTKWEKDLGKWVLKGKTCQPPVYLELLDRSGAYPGYKPWGAAYYAVENAADADGGAWSYEFAAETWGKLRKNLLDNYAGFLRLIEQGQFLIAPQAEGERHCTYCEFSSACRYRHPPSRQRAEESSIRKAYDGFRGRTPAATEEAK